MQPPRRVEPLIPWWVFAIAVGGALLMWVAVAYADSGYLPTRFVGKCDPWPGNQPLPNDQLRACYLERYGVEPGVRPERIGYSAELFGINFDALQHWCEAGEAGPGHDCNTTTTEAVDASFTEGRGGPFIGRWVVPWLDGGTAAKPIITHEATRACGPYSRAKVLLNSYTAYFDNQPPCGQVAPPPPVDPPPPPPDPPPATLPNCYLAAGPLPPASVLMTGIEMTKWVTIGPGRRARLTELANWLRTYQPKVSSTGQIPCVLRALP